MVGTRDEVITRVKEEREIVREEGDPELKGRGVPIAFLILVHGNAAYADLYGKELGPQQLGGNNYPENGLMKPPRRGARALNLAGMFEERRRSA